MLEDAFRTPIIRTSRSNCGKVNCFTSHAPLASKQKDKDTRKRASHQHSKWKLRYGWLIVSAPPPLLCTCSAANTVLIHVLCLLRHITTIIAELKDHLRTHHSLFAQVASKPPDGLPKLMDGFLMSSGQHGGKLPVALVIAAMIATETSTVTALPKR